ncbi:GNAT family N-acetyltransferase [Pelomonas sp. APW6]|uniref:GNAT family N-acetyltransferase n=1 Tax=Roseateles subflavus TaxID=3053353 RepID=A0ABT7LD53_9BURK|nr:GNAT family N-acetyltransferase [Pelomonas sp. APW6]MDL5030782.1 GNAT family N-acetyltransferase [Pelomonas sp. APW6]
MHDTPATAPPPRLVRARMDLHGPALLALNTEYLTWVFAEMARQFGALPAALTQQPVSAYAAAMLDKVCADVPPAGCFYLLERPGAGGQPATIVGMGGLRRLDAQRAEIKRLYLRPDGRGQGLGARLLAQLIDDARAFGYRALCLDSAPFMHEAQALYRRHGFEDAPAYAGTEVPGPLQSQWRFMQRAL